MEKTYKFLKLLIWVLLFVVLMAGAWVLYNRLSDNVSVVGISVVQPAKETASETVQETVPETAHETAHETTQPVPQESVENTTSPTTAAQEELYPAPDFTVYDRDGNRYKLSDFQGKPVLLNFWASWCGPCKSEMPDIEKAFSTYGDEIHFLIVNMTDGQQETVESAFSYISDNGYTFPVYFDTQQEAAYAYGVYSIPVTYLIDSDGNYQGYFRGAMSSDILQQGIDLLLP